MLLYISEDSSRFNSIEKIRLLRAWQAVLAELEE
jgi:hypothetical protein